MYKFIPEFVQGRLYLVDLCPAGLGHPVHIVPHLFRIDSGNLAQCGRSDYSCVVFQESLHIIFVFYFIFPVKPVRIDGCDVLADFCHYI